MECDKNICPLMERVRRLEKELGVQVAKQKPEVVEFLGSCGRAFRVELMASGYYVVDQQHYPFYTAVSKDRRALRDLADWINANVPKP